MANRIKGITIEIGGDTTGLDKPHSTIRNTQPTLVNVTTKVLKWVFLFSLF